MTANTASSLKRCWILFWTVSVAVVAAEEPVSLAHHGFPVEDKTALAGLQYAADPPHCYFPTQFVSVPVIASRHTTHDSKIVTFGLPEGMSLDLPVSSAIVMKVLEDEQDGNDSGKKKRDVMRPYNPISNSRREGSFDILVKIYPGGKAGTYVGQLKAGDAVSFKQTKPNVKKFRYPFFDSSNDDDARNTITMIAGGTGVAPMLQALYPLLETPGDRTRVRLLYGNKSAEDILLRPELDELARRYPDRLRIHYVIGDTAEHTGGTECAGGAEVCGTESDEYEYGWIDEEKIRRLGFPPADPGQDGSSAVWICGVDAMYNSLAGSRLKRITQESTLYRLGYRDDAVWRS